MSDDVEISPTGVLSGPDVAHRVVLGAIQRAGGFLVLNLITALAAILLLRYLGVASFGRYGTVMALMTIVQGVSDAGLSMTGSRELSLRTETDDRNELLGTLLSLRILLTGAGTVIAIIFAITVGYSRTMVEGAALVGGGVILTSIQSALLLPLVVKLENWRLAVNDVVRQLVLVLSFAALAVAGAPLLPFFGASLIGAATVCLLTPMMLKGARLARPRWASREIRALALRALPLAISGVLSVLYFRVLVVLMSVLQPSAKALGFYVTSSRVIEIFLTLPVILVGVVLPVLSVSARQDMGRLQYVTLRMTQTLAVLGVLFALVLSVGARPVLLILGGAQYLGAASVLRIQSVALITIFIAGAWTTTLVGMGRTREMAVATLIGLLAVAGFGSAFILAFGAEGAAAAAVAADAVFCATCLYFLRAAGAAAGLSADPFVRIALCALPGVLLGIVRPLPDLADCILAGVVFCALLAPTSALPPELVDRLRAAARWRGRPHTPSS